jgi:hypothetical protein
MVQAVALENNYCTLDDVVTEVNKTDSVTPLFTAQVNSAINQASRLIDDYCYTKFYKQDFSTNFFDLRYKEHLKGKSDLYLFFPVGSITSIEEDNKNLTAGQFVLEEGSKIIRLDASSGDLVDWGTKIRIKAKFGYNLPGSCTETGYLTLPFLIRKQAAIFAAYIAGLRKIGENTNTNTKTKTGKEIRGVPNIPMNSGIIASVGGATEQGFSFIPNVNPNTEFPKTFSGKVDVWRTSLDSDPFINAEPGVSVSLGWEAPINQTEIIQEVKGISMIGFIPKFEYAKLDPYRFLRF